MRMIHDRTEVDARISAMAADIADDLQGMRLCLVVIAEGARRFADRLTDGLRQQGVEIDQVLVRVRRTRGTRLLPPAIEIPAAAVFTGRDVLVVDDIADEGRTLATTLDAITSRRPRSLRSAVLVDKLARRAVAVPIDYKGFELHDGWVVGMGMDLDESYRDLDYLAIVDEQPR